MKAHLFKIEDGGHKIWRVVPDDHRLSPVGTKKSRNSALQAFQIKNRTKITRLVRRGGTCSTVEAAKEEAEIVRKSFARIGVDV